MSETDVLVFTPSGATIAIQDFAAEAVQADLCLRVKDDAEATRALKALIESQKAAKP